jgi:hypothetical protein
MNQKTRHYLFLFFVLLFCIITPAISLYASGYKINKGFKLQKTGILIIDSEPADAKIYIDNKVQQTFLNKILQQNKGFTTTPEKIKNILPGEYKVRVEKENYWPWEKKLTIKSGETTFAEDIRLFKKDLPVISQNGDFLDAEIYLIDDKLITIKDDKITFQDKEEEKIITYSKTPETNNKIKISPRGEKAIIGKYIYNLQNPEDDPLSLNQLVGATSENIQWGKNDNELYYINGSLLNKFNISDNKFITLFRQINLKDYLVKNDLLYFINNQNQSVKLNTYDLDKERVSKTISLPLSEYSFQNTQHHLINLYDQNHKILYLIQADSPFKPLQESLNNVEKSFWLDDETLIYTNEFEIWKFNLNTGEKTLLTRISSTIESIIAHPENNYILFLANNTINVLELDNREKYNITKILELKNIKNLMIDKKGETIYFSSQIGSQKGIFKLAI